MKNQLRPRIKKRHLNGPPSGVNGARCEVQALLKYFPTLQPDKLDRLAKEMSLVRLNRGGRVLDSLRSPTDIFLVLKGAIAVTWQQDGCHQVLVTLLAPGEMFGVSSLLPEMAKSLNGYAFTS